MEIKGREKTQKLTFEEISQLNERKRELKDQHAAYIGEHPELKNILSDFMAAVLLEKPDDTFAFAAEHFAIGLPKKEHAKKKTAQEAALSTDGRSWKEMTKSKARLAAQLIDADESEIDDTSESSLLREAFTLFDVDNSGDIDSKEVRSMLGDLTP